MPGATLHDSMSMSSLGFLLLSILPLVVAMADFLAGVTVNSLLSGGMILMERATRSLFLKKGLEMFVIKLANRTIQIKARAIVTEFLTIIKTAPITYNIKKI